MTRLRPALAGSLALLAGCSASGSLPGYSREVGADGRVLVTYASGLPRGEDTLVSLFDIGRYVDDTSPIFEQLRDVEVDAEGRIYALDYQAAHIRLFGPDGDSLTTLGRRGEGPGELTNANGLRLGPDGTLWVRDHGKNGILALALDGTERDRLPSVVPGFGFRWGVTIDTAGVLWEQWSRQLSGPAHDLTATGVAEGRSLRMYMRLDPATGQRDSVMLNEGGWRSYRVAFNGGQTVMGLPFAGRSGMVMDRHRRVWITDADSFAVIRLNLEADTTLILRANEPGIPVTESDIADWRDALSEEFEGQPGLIDNLSALIPDTRPLLAASFTDDRDRLWLGRTVANGDMRRWDVFTPEAEFITTVRGPSTSNPWLTPVVRGDRIYLFADGEAGERYIVVAELPARLRDR